MMNSPRKNIAMKSIVKTARVLWIILLVVSPGSGQQPGASRNTKDIRNLSQHFTNPENISPWMFVPQGDNIKSLSTTDHPGLVTIRHGDKGKDIKGILKNPIKIDEYSIPWEF